MRRPGIVNLVYAAMAVSLLAGPSLLTQAWSSAGPGTPELNGPDTSRFDDRVLEVDGWASEGFAGLSEELAARAEAPNWEEVRRVMERRGCTGLRYALRIRVVLHDGTLNDRTLVRRPYFEPQHADEFLRYLRGGPEAAVWLGSGEPPWRSDAIDGL